MTDPFLLRLDDVVRAYLASVADSREHLSLLRWQIAAGHRLDDRATLPGHITTSAMMVSPDERQILLVDHIIIGRWLQPGGHYEPAATFHESAMREAIEETGVKGLHLHPWHGHADLPFAIDSHDVPSNPKRAEPTHVHHDLQYLFIADPVLPLVAQAVEVHAATWHPIEMLKDFAPRVLSRLRALSR